MEAVHDPRARLRRMHEVLLERRPATEMRASAARPLRCCMRLVQRVWGGSYLAGPASGNPTADASDFKSHWACAPSVRQLCATLLRTGLRSKVGVK